MANKFPTKNTSCLNLCLTYRAPASTGLWKGQGKAEYSQWGPHKAKQSGFEGETRKPSDGQHFVFLKKNTSCLNLCLNI